MGGEPSAPSGDALWPSPMGSETDLLRIRGAQLFLIDGEESVLMQSGDFAFLLVKQSRSPLAAVIALVGDVQWPIGKDSPVMRVGNASYTFSLPSVVYGLFLPDATELENVQRLEALLQQHATFETHPDITAGLDRKLPKAQQEAAAAEYWTSVATQVESTSARIARQILGGSSLAARTILRGGELAAPSIQQGVSAVKNRSSALSTAVGQGGSLELSPKMMKRIQQARRMSAVAKLFSKALSKGVISATGHVGTSVVGAVNSTPPGRAFRSSGMRDVAVASVDAFAKVVEAVETAGKNMLETAGSIGKDLVHQRYGDRARQAAQEGFGAVGNVIDTAWTLNQMGLRMLLRVTAASTALNISSTSRSMKTQSTTNLLLSSSTSTISSSSRSFSPPPPFRQANTALNVPLSFTPLESTSTSSPDHATPSTADHRSLRPTSSTTSFVSFPIPETSYASMPSSSHPTFPASSVSRSATTKPLHSLYYQYHHQQQDQQPEKSAQ